MIVPLDVEAGKSLHQASPVVPLHRVVVAAAGLGPPDDDHRGALINSADVSHMTEIRVNLRDLNSPHSTVSHIEDTSYIAVFNICVSKDCLNFPELEKSLLSSRTSAKSVSSFWDHPPKTRIPSAVLQPGASPRAKPDPTTFQPPDPHLREGRSGQWLQGRSLHSS